jgi:hypothetical protein
MTEGPSEPEASLRGAAENEGPFKVAAGPGLEPGIGVPKTPVLPLRPPRSELSQLQSNPRLDDLERSSFELASS